MSKSENQYVQLARDTIEAYVQEGKIPSLNEPLADELNREAGAFVSIKKNGQLRGCIGTIQAVRDNLAEEIRANAISAAVRDPRFPPVRKEELSELDISVDILEEPETIDNMDELDPAIYGVIVEKGYHRGVLLPNLEGIDTVEEQVEIAMRKAGLSYPDDLSGTNLYRFRVTRYK